MGYSGYVADTFCFEELMRTAAGEPPPPEPTVQAAATPAVTQTGTAPSPLEWRGDTQVATFSDGSQQGQLLGKNVAKMRWGMAKAFATKVAPHGVGGHLATLQDNVTLEALDPKHRMGEMLNHMLRVFKEVTPPIFHAKLSLFFLWIDGFCRDVPADVTEILVKEYGEPGRAMCEDFVRAGVAYKDKAEERKPYMLTFRGGKVYRGGELFDTSKCVTAHSGAGWAIYVVNPRGQWFAGSHRVGAFHHSTFLGGRPVLSAGEMQVVQGAVTVLTAKSGHYQPTMEQFVNGLKSLKRACISLDRCQVEVYEGRGKPVRIAAVPFMVNSYLQARHLVWG
jgi:hypothetical protein